MRERRKRLDGYRCVYCGATRDLTVDLDPRLHGNHRVATITDCVTACRSCNSRRGALGRDADPALLDPAPRELRHGRTNREGLAKKKMVAVVALVVIAAVLIYALAA